MTRKLLFIVNPNAGKKNPDVIIQSIREHISNHFSYQISVWKNKDDFEAILQQCLHEDFTDVIAVGGDGTVNKVASSIVHSSKTFGIIPAGSGNGLARVLGISMNIEKAIKQVIDSKKEFIDHGEVNGRKFFCTSGIGFDAHIAHLFSQSKTRGLKNYVKLSLKQFFNYKPRHYKLTLNGQTILKKAYLITMANAGQFGNDFYIAPEASLTDGFFHVVIVKPFKFYQIPNLLLKILRHKLHTSQCVETYITTELRIESETEEPMHLDGEPQFMGKSLHYKIQKHSLLTIVGKQM